MSMNFEQLKQQMILLKQIVQQMPPEEKKQFAMFCIGLFKEVLA